ncbi:MAG: hypothetical protein ACOX7F_08305 [Eubacteriales bacterium]|jgi:hypothetical protein
MDFAWALSIVGGAAEGTVCVRGPQPVGFHKGYYQADIHYYFKVTLEMQCSGSRPVCVEGLAVYDKKAILFGSEGNAKVFSSNYIPCAADLQRGLRTNSPQVSVEVVDPVILGSKVVEPCEHTCGCCEVDTGCLPEAICCCFSEPLAQVGERKLLISLGLFTIIRISREVQLLIPSYDFCIPAKESSCDSGDAPCDLFRKFQFPVDEFFPPRAEQIKDDCCGK